MNDAVVISSHAAVARSYPDLPFDTTGAPEAAARVVSRTAAALEESGYALHLLREMAQDSRLALAESGQISRSLLRAEATAAVLLPADGAALVSVGGEEHVVLSACQPGLKLAQAAEDCFRAEDILASREKFAYDDQLGYLTGEPSLLGTGLRLRVRLHLPMMVRAGKLGGAAAAVMEQGLRLYPAFERPEGDVLELANASAMGRTEQELCQLVTQEAEKLCAQESTLRSRALQEQPAQLADRVSRALGLLKYARLMPEKEFWRLWSDLRLGAAMGLLPLMVEQADQLIHEAMPAHLRSYAEEPLEGERLDECRASRVRELLEEEPLA